MFGQELKKMGIATAYRYIEKNPKDNLRKLMTWVDRIAGEGPDSFEEQRKVIWDILDHPESNMYQLIMRVIEEVDPEVVKTVFSNFFLNAAILGWPKQEKLRAEYNCNIPWAILLVGKMADLFKEEYEMEKFVEGLFAQLCAYKEELQKEGAVPGEVLAAKIQSLRREVEQKKAAGQLTKAEMHRMERILCKLEEYQKAPEFESVKATFNSEEEQREQMADKTLETLNHCFEFLESAFGESQEMAVFVTELNSNVYSIAFLRENDCAMYYKYNKGLLLDERREEILEQMDAVENVVERGLVED